MPLIYRVWVRSPARLDAPEAMVSPAVKAAEGAQDVCARSEGDGGGGGEGRWEDHQNPH